MARESRDAKVDSSDRDKNVNTLAAHIRDCLDLQRDLDARGRFCGLLFYGKHYGVYITGLYLVVKVLFFVNTVGQFFILNRFLGFPDHKLWGYDVLKDLVNGREWPESGHFPRVTMCDFEVRVLGNLHRHTVQCVLMINMFNEKIFVFLWWWFIIVAVATIINLMMWLYNVLIPAERQFVTRYLRVTEDLGPSDKPVVDRFVRGGLRPDGILLLRLIANNAGDILATDLIHALWTGFRKREPPPPPMISTASPLYNKGKDMPLLRPGEGFDDMDYPREEIYPTGPPTLPSPQRPTAP